MTDPQQVIDIYKQFTGELFRVFCGYIGITILILAILTCYKKHQRELLWAAGIIMILIIMALSVIGILDMYDLRDRLILIMGFICPCLYVCTAEKIYRAKMGKRENDLVAKESIINAEQQVTQSAVLEDCSSQAEEDQEEKDSETSIEKRKQDDDTQKVILPPRLSTELAINVFEKAKKDRFITEVNGHYVWSGTKVLLAYLCGRIYCEDKSEYEKVTGINKWKQGKLSFPETALNELFNETNLGQSRRSREFSACPDGFRKIDSYF